MIQELVYTSASRGLKPGSRGFCTVASTQGMALNLAERLESLSGYRHLFAPQDPQATLNPIVWSHLRITLGGQGYHVLSRVASAGLDYTQRSNKFAHHLVLDATDLHPAGPAAMLVSSGLMEQSWEGTPRLMPVGRVRPQVIAPPAGCPKWKELTNDAGWAGFLAETAWSGTAPAQLNLIYPPGTDVLPLFVESLNLLPPQRRWLVTFSTYYTQLPPGVDCHWRAVVDGTPEAVAARRLRGTLLLDLTKPLGNAGTGMLAQAARAGKIAVAVPISLSPINPVASEDAKMEKSDALILLEEPPVLHDVSKAIRNSRPDALPPERLRAAQESEQRIGPRFSPKGRAKWPLYVAAAFLFILAGGLGIAATLRYGLLDNLANTTSHTEPSVPPPTGKSEHPTGSITSSTTTKPLSDVDQIADLAEAGKWTEVATKWKDLTAGQRPAASKILDTAFDKYLVTLANDKAKLESELNNVLINIEASREWESTHKATSTLYPDLIRKLVVELEHKFKERRYEDAAQLVEPLDRRVSHFAIAFHRSDIESQLNTTVERCASTVIRNELTDTVKAKAEYDAIARAFPNFDGSKKLLSQIQGVAERQAVDRLYRTLPAAMSLPLSGPPIWIKADFSTARPQLRLLSFELQQERGLALDPLEVDVSWRMHLKGTGSLANPPTQLGTFRVTDTEIQFTRDGPASLLLTDPRVPNCLIELRHKDVRRAIALREPYTAKSLRLTTSNVERQDYDIKPLLPHMTPRLAIRRMRDYEATATLDKDQLTLRWEVQQQPVFFTISCRVSSTNRLHISAAYRGAVVDWLKPAAESLDTVVRNGIRSLVKPSTISMYLARLAKEEDEVKMKLQELAKKPKPNEEDEKRKSELTSKLQQYDEQRHKAQSLDALLRGIESTPFEYCVSVPIENYQLRIAHSSDWTDGSEPIKIAEHADSNQVKAAQ